MTLKQYLIDIGACLEVIEWIENKTLQEAWQQCDRSDWMLWFLTVQRVKPSWPTYKEIVVFLCDILSESQDQISQCHVDYVRNWAKDEITVTTAEIKEMERDPIFQKLAISWLYDLILMPEWPDLYGPIDDLLLYLDIEIQPEKIRSYFQIPRAF
jgi:hypothetical protein